MGRRNLDNYWGRSRVTTARLAGDDIVALRELAALWQVTESEAIRRCIREAAKREGVDIDAARIAQQNQLRR